jgi:hypothetical protein
VSTRVLRGAFRGRGHVLDPEVFDPDHIESARQVRGYLLGPVLAPVGLAAAQPGDSQLDPRAAVRAAPGPGQLAFQAPHARALPRGPAGGIQHLPGRQGRGYRYPPVDAHHLAVTRHRDWVGDGSEGNVPASGPVHRHPIGLHARRHHARPAEPHPAGLRHPDLSDVARQAAHVPLPPAPPHDPEPLVPPGLAPRWPPRRVVRVEEGGHRLGEVPQRLLLHRLGACRQPRMLGPCLGQLAALLRVARRGLPARMPVLVLLNGEVPHVPGVRAVVTQHRFLNGAGVQPEPGHTNILANTADIPGI